MYAVYLAVPASVHLCTHPQSLCVYASFKSQQHADLADQSSQHKNLMSRTCLTLRCCLGTSSAGASCHYTGNGPHAQQLPPFNTVTVPSYELITCSMHCAVDFDYAHVQAGDDLTWRGPLSLYRMLWGLPRHPRASQGNLSALPSSMSSRNSLHTHKHACRDVGSLASELQWRIFFLQAAERGC